MAPINNRSTNHLNSPYARTPRKTYGARSQNQPPSTPGSLFKRVTQIFTPAAWLNGSASSSFKKRPSFTENELNSVVEEAERSITVHDTKESLLADSPNVKLANFFANKGTQPLTDIEIEGVKSLLAQSQSSVSTPNKRKFSMTALGEPEEPSTPTVLKNESGKTILRQTPRFNASYSSSNNTAETSTSNSLVKAPASKSVTPFKRKVFDYSAFPSPYRSSRLKNSILYLENDKNDNKKAKVEEPVVEEKKLSSTASALLSFLDNTEPNSTTGLPTTTSAPSSSSSSSALSSKDTSNSIDYSNPYASKTKRARKALVHRKPSKFEQLEKSFASASKTEQTDSPTTATATATATPNKQLTTTQAENDASAGTTPISTEGPSVDTHKPIISSALRKSITFESSDDVSLKQATSTTPSAKPFQFDVQAKSSSNEKDETPSKPSLFSLGATNKEDNNKLSGTTSSGFNFGGTKVSKEEKKTNALDTTTTVAPTTTTTTTTEEEASSKPLQPVITVPTSSIPVPVPGSKEFTFTFPDVSESSKYSQTDVVQSQLEQFKDLFAF
ncbi:hypothetical protein WICPIJ_009303 [Wickerhamomyces pijperi]|uniref:Uncharacterized protein n=1 Tax=Wickerhamomyces pijperi TaxID=599730 RepID=A0A9P8PP41_WICPI|nr:hypothetical protein WICPIJ_009303 [Wickerhamomyces pijperi]